MPNLTISCSLNKKLKKHQNLISLYLLVAGDVDLSRAVKGGLLCKEILDHSVPLLRLVEHILSAKVSIDLCLYMLTQHKLGKAVIQQLKKTNIRVRFIVNESSSKAQWKIQTFLTAILRHGLRNCSFLSTHLLFPFPIWTFISLFSLDFYFPFSLWTFISLFSLDFYLPYFLGLLFPFPLWTFISL